MNEMTQKVTIQINELDGRPRKKQKLVASNDTVNLWSEVGMTYFAIGAHRQAEESFCRAIHHKLGTPSTEVHVMNDGETFDNFVDSAETDSRRAEIIHRQLLSTIPCASAMMVDNECNEGLRAYDKPVPLNHSLDEESIICTLLYNIAQTYVRRNQYENARIYLEQALGRIDYLKTSTAPIMSIRILHNLGYCHFRMGLYSEAIRCYEYTLWLVLKFELDETDLAVALNCIGVLQCHYQCNDIETAMSLLQKSLNIYLKVQQQRSPWHSSEIATVLYNIGRVHVTKSEYKKAITVFMQALEIRRRILGEYSIHVATLVHCIAQTFQCLGRLEDAMKYYTQFVHIARSCNQTDSMDVANVYKCMADIECEHSKLENAIACYKESLRIKRSINGSETFEASSILNTLGNICYQIEDYKNALIYYKESLEIEKALLPDNDPRIIITESNLANTYKNQCNYRKALSYFQRVFSMQQRIHHGNAEKKIELAESLSNVGLMHYHLKDFHSALESYQDALRIQREFYGSDDHVEVASTLNSVGLVLFKQKTFDWAKRCFYESLRIRRQIYGHDHQDVGILYFNIACLYFAAGDDEVSIKFYKESLRVEREALGHDHINVVITLKHLGEVFQQLGDLDMALKYFLEGLEIERNRSKVDHTTLGRLLNLVGNVYLQQGNTTAMMKYFVEGSRIQLANTKNKGEQLVIQGYNLYTFSKLLPPCAPVA